MPYTMATLPNFVKKKPQKKQKQWLAVWNSSYSRCIDKGGGKKSCETSAFKQANSVVGKDRESDMGQDKQSLIRSMWLDLTDFLFPSEEEPKTVERSVNLDRLRSQVYTAVRENDQSGDVGYYSWPIDVYMDDDKSFFAIVARNGSIWQVPLTLGNDEVELGEWVRVIEKFEPIPDTTTRSITIIRQADGKTRYIARAATAVLNRVGEIDSTDLFDSFVTYAEENKYYPMLQFYHQGDKFRLGQSDWIGRDGVIYLQSGLFDDTEIGRAAAKTLEKDSTGWGISIGYEPKSLPDLVEIADDVSIPVYRKGINHELSLLPEEDAAAFFTGLCIQTEVERSIMNDQMKAALKKLLGEDNKAVYDKIVAEDDDINRSVKDDKLVYREKDGKEKEAVEGQLLEVKDAEVVIEEATIAEITKVVRAAFEESFKTLGDTLARISGEQEKATGLVTDLTKRLTALEQDDESKVRAIVNDMPAKSQIRVTHRARDNAQTHEVNTDEHVSSVFSAIPSTGYPVKK